jgi:hypothetical protein
MGRQAFLTNEELGVGGGREETGEINRWGEFDQSTLYACMEISQQTLLHN